MQTTTVPMTGQQPLPVAEDLASFCQKEGITAYLQRAIEATREMFPNAEAVTTSLRRDEYGVTFVAIDARIADDPGTEAEKYSRCMERWASLIPPQHAGKIQLSTSWAG